MQQHQQIPWALPFLPLPTQSSGAHSRLHGDRKWGSEQLPGAGDPAGRPVGRIPETSTRSGGRYRGLDRFENLRDSVHIHPKRGQAESPKGSSTLAMLPPKGSCSGVLATCAKCPCPIICESSSAPNSGPIRHSHSRYYCCGALSNPSCESGCRCWYCSLS